MKELFHKILHSHGILSKALLVASGIAVMVILLPDEVRFKYDFESGRPWMHEDLYAPFDFPILKPAEVLEKERAALKASAVPYFAYNDSVIVDIKANLQIALDVAYPDANVTELVTLEQQAMRLLYPVLNKGIIAQHPVLDSLPEGIIRVVRSNTATDKGIEELHTLQSAVDFLIQKNSELAPEDSSLLVNLCVENLQPTLYFDSVLTQKELNAKLEALPPVYGKVSEAERVVSKGELIDEEIYGKLESLRQAYDKRTANLTGGLWIDVGRVILISVNLIILALYLFFYRADIMRETNKFGFVMVAFVLFVSVAEISSRYELVSLYMIPFPLLAVLIRNFFDSRLAAFIVLIQAVLVGLIAPNGYEFVFLQAITGVITAFAMNNLRRRSHLLRIAGLTFFVYSVLYSAFTLLKEGTPEAFNLHNYGAFAISSGLMLLTYPLVFVFEKTFKLVSEVTLLELADTNNPLLRKLLNEAPGTFQHSLQVANLAEDAAQEVGGDALLVRTAALYHDIGKMKHPEYFIENQVAGQNPHDELTPEASTKIIINHVIEGVELARKHALPEQIIDFIRTHHGDTRVRFFLHAAKQVNPEVNEQLFRYPGPLPFSKESAILMMVDAVEAASRSLKDYTSEGLEQLVETIINNQQQEGQFNHADITLLEITRIKSLLKNRLKSIYHVRVPYPKSDA